MSDDKVIKLILDFLYENMEKNSVDPNVFNADGFALSEPRFNNILEMLEDEGWIRGLTKPPILGKGKKGYDVRRARITIGGIEYRKTIVD